MLALDRFLCHNIFVKKYIIMQQKNYVSSAETSAKVMKLSFFAKRFNVQQKWLSWGIVISENEDQEIKILPAVLIKGTSLFIDISEDRLDPLVNICGCRSASYQATVTENENAYIFSSGRDSVSLKKDVISTVYARKFFTKDLAAQAKNLG